MPEAQFKVSSTISMTTATPSPTILKKDAQQAETNKSEDDVSRVDAMKPIDEAETAAGSVTSDSNSPCPSDTGVVDVNGTDLDSVLYNAVRNPKDRLFVLKLEQQCEAFAKDDSQTQLEFSHMNSYQRLIIYRMAAHFKMVHTPNTLNKGVLIHKNEKSEVPTLRLADVPVESDAAPQAPKTTIKIMQRHAHHKGHHRHLRSDKANGQDGNGPAHKTMEEREAAYQAARARIFQEDSESDVSNTSRNSNQSGQNKVRGSKAQLRGQGRPKQSAGGRQRLPLNYMNMQYPPQQVEFSRAYLSYENSFRPGLSMGSPAPSCRLGALDTYGNQFASSVYPNAGMQGRFTPNGMYPEYRDEYGYGVPPPIRDVGTDSSAMRDPYGMPYDQIPYGGAFSNDAEYHMHSNGAVQGNGRHAFIPGYPSFYSDSAGALHYIPAQNGSSGPTPGAEVRRQSGRPPDAFDGVAGLNQDGAVFGGGIRSGESMRQAFVGTQMPMPMPPSLGGPVSGPPQQQHLNEQVYGGFSHMGYGSMAAPGTIGGLPSVHTGHAPLLNGGLGFSTQSYSSSPAAIGPGLSLTSGPSGGPRPLLPPQVSHQGPEPQAPQPSYAMIARQLSTGGSSSGSTNEGVLEDGIVEELGSLSLNGDGRRHQAFSHHGQ